MTEDTSEMANGRIAIGVDVGGSGIKAAVVDVESGRLRSERIRVPTPNPSTPDAILASISRVVKRLAKSSGLGESTPVGIGLPGVAIDGTLKSAANIDPAWIDFPVVERMGRLIKRPISIINDADAAGIAEMRFGVGKDQPGVVIFLTLGTGPACSTTASWSRTPSSARWRSAGGPQSDGPRPPPGSGAGCRGRPGRPTSTSSWIGCFS